MYLSFSTDDKGVLSYVCRGAKASTALIELIGSVALLLPLANGSLVVGMRSHRISRLCRHR